MWLLLFVEKDMRYKDADGSGQVVLTTGVQFKAYGMFANPFAERTYILNSLNNYWNLPYVLI